MKKNLLKIPQSIYTKIQRFSGKDFRVAIALKISNTAIREGKFSHLNITYKDDEIELESSVIPQASQGRYSKKNYLGYEIVHYDLPKTLVSWTIEAPNYGDWYNGSHTIEFSKEAYRRTFIGPKYLEILINILGQEPTRDRTVIQFSVDQVLNTNNDNWEDDLLFNLNLLQENVYNCDVELTTATMSDYLKTIFVNWEILPPGEGEEKLKQIISGISQSNPELGQKLLRRKQVIDNLKPEGYIYGFAGNHKYFGAKFNEDLVAFENLNYGNAIYIMFEDWEELSKKSRTELLKSEQDKFIKIVHNKHWEKRFKAEIRSRLRAKKKKIPLRYE